MKRLGSSSESSDETVGVMEVVGGGAEEVGGAEDVTAFVTTLVDSVRGAVETGTESTDEG